MSRSTSVPVTAILPRARSSASAIIETTKPRITRMVVVTAVIGAALAALWRGGVPWSEFGLTLAGVVAGTALSASGANSLNQWMERFRDAKMRRTRGRPLPAHEVSPGTVFLAGAGLSLMGALALWAFVGWVPALVSLSCTLTYVLLYTPMKVLTPWATLVGAIPGALPPLIGWTAVSGAARIGSALEWGGLSLVVLMTIWQLPHFLAIAWMYREDYADGGFRVLPVLDPSGRATSWAMLVTAGLLVPASLMPAWALSDLVGWAYGVVALGTGLWYLWMCVRLTREQSVAMARRVFLASVIHLPILLVALVGDALI